MAVMEGVIHESKALWKRGCPRPPVALRRPKPALRPADGTDVTEQAKVEAFIARWTASVGGAERAN